MALASEAECEREDQYYEDLFKTLEVYCGVCCYELQDLDRPGMTKSEITDLENEALGLYNEKMIADFVFSS